MVILWPIRQHLGLEKRKKNLMSQLKKTEELFSELKSRIDSVASTVQQNLQHSVSIHPKKIKLCVVPHVMVRREPPPYFIPDFMYAHLSQKRVMALLKKPIIVLFRLKVDGNDACDIWEGALDVDEFDQEACLKSVLKSIKSPKSFIWLRIAWHVNKQFGIKELKEEEMEDDPADYWKKGKKDDDEEDVIA